MAKEKVVEVKEKEPEPEPQKKLNLTPKLAATFGLMLLLLLFLGYYFVSNEASKKAYAPTPTATPADETASWKTYNDKTHNFSVKYPTNWEVFIIDGQIAVLIKESKPFGNYIHLEFSPNPNKLNSAEYVQQEAFKNDLQGWNNDKQPRKTVKVAGIDAIRLEKITGGAGDFGPVVYLTNGNVAFKFRGTFDPADFNLYEQILSTFKFIEASSQSSPSPRPSPTISDNDGPTETITYVPNKPWQTFADNPGAYEIRFPPGYEINDSNLGANLYINNCNGGNCSTGFSVVIHHDYDGGSRRAWFDEKRRYELTTPYYQDLIIQGSKALLIMDGDTGSLSNTFVLVPRGSRMYQFTFPSGWNPETGEKPNLPFIKEVLSTFKFL